MENKLFLFIYLLLRWSIEPRCHTFYRKADLACLAYMKGLVARHHPTSREPKKEEPS
jgi:hypothetical protein